MSRRPLAAALACIVLGLVAACGGSSSDSRDDAADGVTRSVLVPSYEQAAARGAELAEAVRALCAAPSAERAAAARASWRDARAAWSRTEAAWIGPVMDRRSEGLVDWPANADRIDTVIASTSQPSEETVLSTSTSARGLGALEHLLFDDGGATGARLRAEPARCAYAQAVADVIADETEGLRVAWVEGEGGEAPYADALSGEGSDGIDGEEAVGMLVERHLFLVERIADQELGASLGMRGTPQPEALAEGAAGGGATDIADRLKGIRAEYVPGDGETQTLGDLLAERDADVQERLMSKLDAAIAIAESIDGPLADDPAGRRRLRTAVKEAQVVLETEVVSVLGVTVGFSDNDGDSG